MLQPRKIFYFNPRSLTGATASTAMLTSYKVISIHAPSRERPCPCYRPYGQTRYFNPRSLTGATVSYGHLQYLLFISIHAPSRERRPSLNGLAVEHAFQSTLPHGSDQGMHLSQELEKLFQSTLPHGSDMPCIAICVG